MEKFIETLQFTNKGTAESVDNKTGEVIAEYDVAEAKAGTGGKRFIVLSPSVRDPKVKQQREELLRTILQRLGEQDSRAFAGLLENAINSYGYGIIEELHNKVINQKQKISTRKGCFEIVIGKGRGVMDTIPLR